MIDLAPAGGVCHYELVDAIGRVRDGRRPAKSRAEYADVGLRRRGQLSAADRQRVDVGRKGARGDRVERDRARDGGTVDWPRVLERDWDARFVHGRGQASVVAGRKAREIGRRRGPVLLEDERLEAELVHGDRGQAAPERRRPILQRVSVARFSADARGRTRTARARGGTAHRVEADCERFGWR